MPDADPTPLPDETGPSGWWRSVLPGLLLAGAAMGAVYAAVGPTLGLYFGGVILVGLIVPVLAAAESCWGRSLVAGLSAAVPVAGWWLWIALRSHEPQPGWPSLEGSLACIPVLVAFVLCVAAMAALVRGLGASTGLTSLVVLGATLAWLTWPVWLSAALAGNDRLAGMLGTPQPLMTINGLMPEFVFWASDCPLAYNYSALSHDVSFRPATSMLPCVTLHAGLAVLFLLPRVVRTIRRSAAPKSLLAAAS